MLRFLSFGSGSSGNCYGLFSQEGGLLLDAGKDLFVVDEALAYWNINPSSICGILITHEHTDHVKYVEKLSKAYNLPVYATNSVHESIIKNHYVKSIESDKRIRYISKGTTFKLQEFNITPFSVPHDSIDNVGYCIETQDTTFCLMTDIGHVTPEMKTYIARAEHLVIEANHDLDLLRKGHYPQFLKERIASSIGHLSNLDCAKSIVENMTSKLRNIWLCHLSQENNHPDLAYKTVEAFLKENKVHVGTDITLHVLRRNENKRVKTNTNKGGEMFTLVP